MISVTRRARQELARILSANVDMPQACLRLLDRGQGQLGIGIDLEMPNDYVVEYKGITLLVVDCKLSSRLEGVVIDIDNSSGMNELIISGV